MRILLVYPYFLEKRIHEEDIRVPPIGLFNVAAVLQEAGHRVTVADLHDKKDRPDDIRRLLSSEQPEVVGLSILHANRWGGIEIARLAREVVPTATVVVGGAGATFLWELLLNRFEEIDYAVLGEGEQAFAELAACLAAGDRKGAAGIAGVAFRKNGRAKCNPPAPPVEDLDALPDPARHYTFQHVVSSRGCPSNCRFCGSPRIWHRRVRFHSPGYFAGQIERLARKGVGFFYVSDDTFTLKPGRVIEICRRIVDKQLAVNWAAISRVDRVNEEMLGWMRRAGCIQISYGVEHGSPKIRERLGKHLDDAQIEAAFSMTTRYGMMARAYFIYGCPGETDRTVGETIDLIGRIRPLSAIFYILDLFPGTELYEEYKKREGVTDEIWLERIEDILYFETDPSLSREQILSFGKKLRTSFYRGLPRFADSVELIEDPAFYPLHADFLSRLGLTFTHGEYAGIEEIPDKEKTAQKLFRRALDYHPDHRAYMGLGILAQRRGEFAESARILEEGIGHFPKSEALLTCLGIDHMNLGDFRSALACFAPFEGNGRVDGYIAQCRRRLQPG
ncbi:MAG: cobalamin-dependent protein [Desulfobacterales bacterium]|jgi:radical SAM superfamily enzyme YgiQ (UPF0313 family)